MALICFALGKQEYALPLSEVHEVAVLPANIAELPKSDDAMLGVAELRNSLVPIVSLSALLGLPHLPADTKRSRIVVTPWAGGWWDCSPMASRKFSRSEKRFGSRSDGFNAR